MLLVKGFYRTGPAIGILATGEEWVVSWFHGDTDTLSTILSEEDQPEASYSTPLQSASTVNNESKDADRYRPLGGTPSQQSGEVHQIEVLEILEVWRSMDYLITALRHNRK